MGKAADGATVELSFHIRATVNRHDWTDAFGVDPATDLDDLREYLAGLAHGVKHGVFGNGEVKTEITITVPHPGASAGRCSARRGTARRPPAHQPSA
jgi:hypothetical protein